MGSENVERILDALGGAWSLMGYLHITNLYQNIDIMQFKECYALEKIHGTSAHIKWKDGEVVYFSGGEKHDNFVGLFDTEELKNKFKEIFDCDVVIYGEAYGGKQQGMSDTYGKDLKFVVFDVSVNKIWLDVPSAENVANKLGLEFVHYVKIPTELKVIDTERDAPSMHSVRNGIEEPKMREGVVLRPLVELIKSNGQRVISKHKRDEFRETKTKREVCPEKLRILEGAREIADEWVTPNRIKNIFSHIKEEEKIIENMGNLIKKVIEDIEREAVGEIIINNNVRKAISNKSVKLIKNKLSKI